MRTQLIFSKIWPTPSPQNTETPGRAVDLITVILRCDISRAVWCNGFTTIHLSVGLHFLEQKWASGKEAHETCEAARLRTASFSQPQICGCSQPGPSGGPIVANLLGYSFFNGHLISSDHQQIAIRFPILHALPIHELFPTVPACPCMSVAARVFLHSTLLRF